MTQPSRSPKRRGRRRSAVGLVLLALFLLGQTYALAHHTLVAHHVCPEDGQLAHGEHGHDVHVEEAEAEPTGPIATSEEGEDGHGDHCAVPTLRDQRDEIAFPLASEAAPLQPGVPDDLPHSQVFASRVPLFRLAPKQSPPQVA